MENTTNSDNSNNIKDISSHSKPTKTGLAKFNEHLEIFIKFIFNTSIIIGGIGAIIFAIYEYQQEHFIFESFDMPEVLIRQGYAGSVVSNRIVDKIEMMKSAANSFKEGDSKLSNSASIPDVSFKVIGVGVSLQNTIEYVKVLIGKPSRKITGEITLQDSIMTLHLRMTGEKVAAFEKSLKNTSQKEALDTLFLQAGAEILKASEPYLLAAYSIRIKEIDLGLSMIQYTINRPPTADDAWAYSLWGGLLVGKDSVAAVDKFQKAIALQDNIPITYGNWANLHVQGKNPEEGLKLYRKTLEIEPNYLFAYVAIGNIYRREKKYKEAEEMYKKALRIKPDYTNALSAWGISLREQKKYNEAVEKYKESLLIDPKQATLYNNLAYLYYVSGQYKEGLEIAKKGLLIAPKDGYLYSTIAELQDGLGNETEFYANFEKAVQNGWKFESALKNEPYSKYLEKPEFKALLEKLKN